MVVDLAPGPDADRAVDDVFHALADPTRRDIVARTLQAEHSVSALARLYPMSFAAVQKHVAVLQRANLITKRPSGREQLVRGNVAALRAAGQALDALALLWRGRLERIDALLAEEPDPVRH